MQPDNTTVVRTFPNGSSVPAGFPLDPMATALRAGLVRLDADRAVLEYEPGPQFLQGAGLIQGGAVCSMLDFAAACAAMNVIDPDADVATVSLNTSFVRPARMGRFVASAEIRKHGRSWIFADVEIMEAQTQLLVATAQAVLHVLSAAPRAAQ